MKDQLSFDDLFVSGNASLINSAADKAAERIEPKEEQTDSSKEEYKMTEKEKERRAAAQRQLTRVFGDDYTSENIWWNK